MEVYAEVDKRDVARVFRVIRKVEPDATAELRSQLKTKMQPLAAKIASEYPSVSPIVNFQNPAWKWADGKVTGKVSFTPGGSRRGAGRTSLVSLSMNYGKAIAPQAYELIGRRKNFSPQGQALYDAIQRRLPGWPNGGRMFYSKFVSSAHAVKMITVDIINKWSDKVSQSLDVK